MAPSFRPAGADPDVWGLRCPEGTGQGRSAKLAGLRLRRIADIPVRRLRQPGDFLTSSFVFIDILALFSEFS
jgi:hypothetical protein